MEKTVESAECERDCAKARMQQMQGRQKKLQSAVSRVQNQIGTLAVGLQKDRDY